MTRRTEKGILLPDALIAAAILTMAGVAAASALAGRAASKTRAAADRASVECFEESLIASAVDASMTAGSCGALGWRVEDFGEERRWTSERSRRAFAWPTRAP